MTPTLSAASPLAHASRSSRSSSGKTIITTRIAVLLSTAGGLLLATVALALVTWAGEAAVEAAQPVTWGW